jgi:Ser/Thr protein kinase RdoA (MazF antagonist)
MTAATTCSRTATSSRNVLFRGQTLVGIVDWRDAGVRAWASDVAYCRGVLAVHPGGSAPEALLAAYESAVGQRVPRAAWDALWAMRGILGSERHWPLRAPNSGYRWQQTTSELEAPHGWTAPLARCRACSSGS